MSKKFVICTFYTPSYKKFLKEWEDSVNQWGYPYVVKEMPDKGNWNLNDVQKPLVIRDIMNEYPDHNVLWCDIDGQIIKRPDVIASLDGEEYDFAGRPCGLRDGWDRFKDKMYGNDCFLGAVLWFANNDISRTFINLWIESCDDNPYQFTADQYNLNITLGEYADEIGLRVFRLPFEYCFCYHHMGKREHEETKDNLKDAVIVQEVASREARRRDRNLGKSWEERLNIKNKVSA